MIVYSVCWKIVRRRIGSLALYVLIFLALSIVIPMISAEQFSAGFTMTRPDFAVINRDAGDDAGDGGLIAGLIEFMTGHGEQVFIEDRKESLQDAAFFGAADYIAIIPRGFSEAFWSDTPVMIETVPTVASARAFYADSLVNQFLNQVRLTQSVPAALESLSVRADVEKKRFGAGAPVAMNFIFYAQMLSYIFLVLLILCIINITSAFRRPDLRMRNLCSPVKPRRMSWQQMLCGVLVGLTVWALLLTAGFILYGRQLAGTDGRVIGLILLNTLVFIAVALAFASFVGMFSHSPNTQNAAANLIGLGLCFLGGVFVPLEILSESLISVSRFTPTYWYMTALGDIASLTAFSRQQLAPVWQSMLIQLAFAVAVFCVALAAGKYMNQSERYFSSARTELEA